MHKKSLAKKCTKNVPQTQNIQWTHCKRKESINYENIQHAASMCVEYLTHKCSICFYIVILHEYSEHTPEIPLLPFWNEDLGKAHVCYNIIIILLSRKIISSPLKNLTQKCYGESVLPYYFIKITTFSIWGSYKTWL